MNKSDIIDSIAKSAGISKAAADRALNVFLNSIMKTLRRGNKVTLVRFGTFEARTRAARIGRNPQTGEELKIKTANVATFKAGKSLRDFVNGGKE